MDDRPRNLRTLLSEAKDISELMVDIAYAALYYAEVDIVAEVDELGDTLVDLAHDMRTMCVVAARSPRDADAMASVLDVVSAIERIGMAAVDIGRIVSHRLGIPPTLVADLAAAEEVSHQVRIREGSEMAHRCVGDLELPTELGMAVVALRRSGEWNTEVEDDVVLVPDDMVLARGPGAGVAGLRALAGEAPWFPPAAPEGEPDLDRAIDTLVEMKNISEVAVGLAYSAVVLRDAGLAAEVVHLEDRLDEMQERLETWVLRSAASHADPSPLRGLLHLSAAAEALGDAAQQMVWPVEQGEELHPILALAFGEAEEVVARVPVAAGSAADGSSLGTLKLETETGFYLLAIRRGGRYLYRPRREVVLRADDELIATGPDEGHRLLAELCGYGLVADDETGQDVLVPLAART